MRRALLAPVLAMAVLAVPAVPARAAAVARVVLVLADGSSIEEWVGQPNLRALMERASVALLSTSTAARGNELRIAREAAMRTLGAGARRGPLAVGPVPRSVLGGALDRAGRTGLLLGDADNLATGVRDRSAAAILGAQEREVPTIVEPFLSGRGAVDGPAVLEAVRSSDADLIVIDPGDLARAQTQDREPDAVRAAMPAALELLDGLVGSLVEERRPDDVLIVAAVMPAIERRLQGIRLAPVAIEGPGFERGLLSSPTTRRQGVIGLPDLTVTIADALGIVLQGPVEGRAARVHPADEGPAVVQALSRDLTHAARSRAVTVPMLRYVGLSAVAAAAVLVLTGRGRRRRRGVMPRGLRATAATGLLVVAATPAAILLEALTPTTTTVPAALAVCAIAVGVAVIARAALGAVRGLTWIAGATVALIVADIALGHPLGYRSSLGPQIAFGGRFFGVDEGVLGITIGATLVWAGAWLDRTPDRARARPAVAAAMAAVIFVLSAPDLGSKFGAALTAMPAFGIFALRARGVRIGARHVAAIAAATTAVAAAFVLADRIAPAAEQSHVARAFNGDSDVWELGRRKVSSAWSLATGTTWGVTALGYAAALLIMAGARRDAFDRAMFGRPHLRAALWGTATAAAVGMVANDGGVLVAAMVLAQGAAAAMLVLMEG